MQKLPVIALFLALSLSLAAQGADGNTPIKRTFGDVELGEFVETSLVCSSLGLPNIYVIERYREISTMIITTRIRYMETDWEEMLIDYLNDTRECAGVFFMKMAREHESLLSEYECLRRSFTTEYGEGTESYSENATSMTCLWEDNATVLRLMVTRSGDNTFSLHLSYSDVNKKDR